MTASGRPVSSAGKASARRVGSGSHTPATASGASVFFPLYLGLPFVLFVCFFVLPLHSAFCLLPFSLSQSLVTSRAGQYVSPSHFPLSGAIPCSPLRIVVRFFKLRPRRRGPRVPLGASAGLRDRCEGRSEHLLRAGRRLEPLVRLIEDTPRDSYSKKSRRASRRGFRTAKRWRGCCLRACGTMQPRPSVGFKFHAVPRGELRTKPRSPDRTRNAGCRCSGRWTISGRASHELERKRLAHEAGRWRKSASLNKARKRSPPRWMTGMWKPRTRRLRGWLALTPRASCSDVFAKYGSRDFRDIGHKIIYVGNAFRVLDVIGWRHAEPVLRSLTYAILKHDGKNPAKEDLEPDRPGRKNADRISKLRCKEIDQPGNGTKDMLKTLRSGSAVELGTAVEGMLAEGVSPRSIWDGLFLGAGELFHAATRHRRVAYAHDA